MDVDRPINQEARVFNAFISNALNARNNVRYVTDPATGITYNHVFEFARSAGMTYIGARKALRVYQQAHPEVVPLFHKLKFQPIPGSMHNQASWGADAAAIAMAPARPEIIVFKLLMSNGHGRVQ